MRIILVSIALVTYVCIGNTQSFKENKTFNIPTETCTGSFVADVNQDGYDDIIYSDKKGILLFINKGNGQIGFDSITLFKNNAKEKTFQLYDADRDGDMDILVGIPGNIILVENQSTNEKISFIKSSKIFYYFANQSNSTPQMLAKDINGDMLVDIVVAYGQTKILFLKPDTTFYSYEIPNSRYNNITKLLAEDLDSDGRPELIFSRIDSIGKLGLYYFSNENNTYSTKIELHNGPIKDFIVTDVNQDIHLDICAIDQSIEGQLLLYLNNDTDSTKFDLHTLTNGGSGHITSLALADIDDMNGVDIIVGFEESRGVEVWWNEGISGTPSFEVNQLDGSQKATSLLSVSDIDKDGDLDIIQILDDDGFLIFEQKDLSTTNDTKQITSVSIYPNPANQSIHIDSKKPFDRVSLFDTAGHLTKDTYLKNLLETTLTLDTSLSGKYILQVHYTDGNISSLPIIVTK